MKKYNRVYFKSFLSWGIILALLFCLSFGSAYAYFTATAKEQVANVSTAIIRVGFSDDTTEQILSSSAVVVDNRALEPGDSVGFSGAIENIGTDSIYAMLVFEVKVNDNLVDTSYYTADGKTELVADLSGKYTDETTIIPATTQNSVAFSLNYLLDGDTYGNSYQNQSVSINITVLAIQQDNVQANNAVNLMLGIN